MKKLSLSLAAALLAAGCASPVPTTGVEARHLFNFTTPVSFDTALGRQVLSADPQSVTKITGSAVHHVDVYMKAGSLPAGLTAADLDVPANGWAKATVTNMNYNQASGTATGTSLTFANLAYGTGYTLVSIARGDDPNTTLVSTDELLVNPNLALSAAQLDVPGPVGGVYQQNLTPASFDVLFPFNADGSENTSASIQALPSKLADIAYNGYAGGVAVKVTDGAVTAAGTATLTSGATGVLMLSRDTLTTNPMGFWNYLALQTDQNGDYGNDSHLVLNMFGLPAGTPVTKISMVADGHEANTVGYVSDVFPGNQLNRQFLGVYANGQYQFRDGRQPVAGANGALTLDLFLDPSEVAPSGYRVTHNSSVSLVVETPAGNVTLSNVHP